MLFFLTGQSLWISGAIIVGGGTLLAMMGPALIRRYVALDRLTINNEIAGFKFATVGVLYARFCSRLSLSWCGKSSALRRPAQPDEPR